MSNLQRQQWIVVFVTMEMMLRQIKGFFAGGLGDLAGHIPEALNRVVKAIPITYGYPVHKQTRRVINYDDVPGCHRLFSLDVDCYWPPLRRTVSVYAIDHDGVQLYLICPPQGLLGDPEGDILYPSNPEIALAQAVLFGRAVEALLKRLGIKPDLVWTQEWRPAVSLIPSMKDDAASEKPFFVGTKFLHTSHTSMKEALNRYPGTDEWWYKLSIDDRYRGAFFDDEGMINPDKGCFALADLVNGVSHQHGQVLRAMYPWRQDTRGVMNGVSLRFARSTRLIHKQNPGWEDLLLAHNYDKSRLVNLVNRRMGQMDPNWIDWTIEDFIAVLIRRIARYKNQHPMFKDIIHELAASGMKILIGGMPHESDMLCRGWAAEWKQWMQDPALKGRFVYLDYYNEDLRLLGTQGCDVWVECPWERCEACGTGIFLAWMNGNLVVATRGGGAMEHGMEIDAAAGTGDTLYIDPYTPQTLAVQLRRMHGWYKDWLNHPKGALWPKLRMNAYRRSDALDVEHMIGRYMEKCFIPLLVPQESAQQAA